MNNLYEKYKNMYKGTFSNNDKNRLNRWVISYADFVTVLVAVFMVLWIGSNLNISDNISDKKIVQNTQKQEQTGPNHLIDGVKNPSDSKEIKIIEFEKTASDLNIALKDKKQTQIIKNDAKITIRLSEGVFFDEGSAIIKADSAQTLDILADELKKNNKQIQIEGHSDNLPVVGGKYSSNWELSSARAINILNYLISKGVDKTRLSAIGYADNKPVAQNNTEEGRSKNRRVDIVIIN